MLIPSAHPRIYIIRVSEQPGGTFLITAAQAEEIVTKLDHLLADLHALAPQVAEMHAELEEFRPLLRMFRPNGGASDLQRAGLLRAARRAARANG
jgi:hypothetical protein